MSKPFTPEGEAGNCEFPPDCMLLCQDGVCEKSVSQPFLSILMWVFFLFAQCVRVAQLVSGFLSEGILLGAAVDLVDP